MGNAGKKVKVHYVGTLDDGTEFDSSIKRGEPIEFVCMTGMMIPGFDKAVEDMMVGQKKYVRIPADEAYGQREESLVQRIPIDQIPNGEALPVGQTIYMQTPAGQPLPVKVVEVANGVATLDMNHEMAGKDLNFEISLMEVEEG